MHATGHVGTHLERAGRQAQLRDIGQFGGERGFKAARAGSKEIERHEKEGTLRGKPLLYAGCGAGPRGGAADIRCPQAAGRASGLIFGLGWRLACHRSH